jgi:hypothetical protein
MKRIGHSVSSFKAGLDGMETGADHRQLNDPMLAWTDPRPYACVTIGVGPRSGAIADPREE